MTVWVASRVEYDMDLPVCVGATLEAAIAALKAEYPTPHIVKWGEPRPQADGVVDICADFEGVVGYSTPHHADYMVTEYPLHEWVRS